MDGLLVDIMGRKLNLTHLSDGECRQILDVIQRDFRLRQREKERIGKLKKKVEEEEEKRSVLSRQQAFNQKHCMRCFSAFGLLFNKRGQCVVCHYFFCKECRLCVHSFMWICKGCITERQLQSQAFEWYYDKIKDRFRRYGSAKVVRSLYKRKSNEYFESPSDQSNTDSGFEHQLSPHRRDNSIPLEDKSTNTGLKTSVVKPVCPASTIQNKDLLESMRPDMENVSTQWPPANRRNSFRSDSLSSPDTEGWQVCSAEDRIDQLKSRTGFVQGEEKEDRFSNFLKNVSGSFQTIDSATVSTTVDDGCLSSGGNVVPDGVGVTVEHQSSHKEFPNGSAVLPKEIYCSSLHGDDVDGEYALESDEDEIFLVASSSLQTDLYQKSNSYGTFTRSVSQPDVGTCGSRKEHSFDDKRSVSVTDISWEMPGLCGFLDDSNIEFQPYSSSEEFSDDSQRINDGSDCSQRSDSSDGSEGDNDGSGGQRNNGNGQRNNSSDRDPRDNDGNDHSQRNNGSDYIQRSDSSDGSQRDNDGSNSSQKNNSNGRRDNDGVDSGQINNGSDHDQRGDGSPIDNDVSDHSQQDVTGDLISFNVNEDVCATCDNTPVDTVGLEGTQNNVTSLVFASEDNFNSTMEQGHNDSRTQRSDIQFQNDLLINSSYLES